MTDLYVELNYRDGHVPQKIKKPSFMTFMFKVNHEDVIKGSSKELKGVDVVRKGRA